MVGTHLALETVQMMVITTLENKGGDRLFKASNIPRKYNTHPKRIKYLVRKINLKNKKILTSGASKTKRKWQLGCILIVLKLVIKSNGGSWLESLEENFPHISVRTIERAMKLSKINMDENPGFEFAGESRLLALLKIAKKTRLELYLAQNKISTKFDFESVREINKFKRQLDRLIKRKSKTKKLKPKTAKQQLRIIYKGIQNYVSIVEYIKRKKKRYKNIEVEQIEDILDELEELKNLLRNIIKSIPK